MRLNLQNTLKLTGKVLVTAWERGFWGVLGCSSTGQDYDEGRVSQIGTGGTAEAQLIESFGEPQNGGRTRRV